MQETIHQILEGHYDYESGALEFSCAKIECRLYAGEVCDGAFTVTGAPGRPTSGWVTVTDPHMECLTERFEGAQCEIRFRFHGEYLEDGDVVKGNFNVISSQGEFYLPFVASVEHRILQSSAGPIKNLFHFTNLAKSSWEEAQSLFYSRDFTNLLVGGDAHTYDLYRGLSARPGIAQNMEEFLVRAGKKQRPEFLIREQRLLFELSSMQSADAVAEGELNVIRNGWGYTCLQIECEGDFLFTERECLLDEHFLGNLCRLQVFADPAQCRPGRNFGTVILSNELVRLEVPVTVSLGEETTLARTHLHRGRLVAELMNLYQDFRLKKVSGGEWRRRSMGLVEQLEALDADDPEPRLFRAQLLIQEKRSNEAAWVLENVSRQMETLGWSDTLRAYYLYLTTLLGSEEIDTDRAAREVEQIYRSDRTNWRVAWLLLYLSPEYGQTLAGKWDFLERQLESGCTSPILYLEALLLANANPALVRRLEGANLRILCYGAHKDALGAELIEQILYLSGRTKEFSELHLRLLEELYERQADERTLQEICTLLIRANRVGTRYFDWYARGVEAQLRITRLYEYYMMSVDLGSRPVLPRTVVMYFSYQNNLDYEHSAFLYAYVLEHKRELPELFENYRMRMDFFVMDQIAKVHINRYLARLYSELLQPALVTEQTAAPLARLLFAQQVTVEDKRLRRVIICEPNLIRPREYPLVAGTTWIALYGNDCALLFEDAEGNRYADGINYDLEKLMIPGKYLHLLDDWECSCPELDLYLCSAERETREWTQRDLSRALRVAGNENVQPALRRRLSMKILQFYYEQDRTEELDQWLENARGEELTARSRALVLKFLVYRGQYEKAWSWICTYGVDETETKPLLRLVCARLEQTGYARDARMLDVAEHVFRDGGRDARLLRYLADYCEGSLRELRDIWKAAGEFGVPRTALEERMLLRMLWCGSYVGEKMEVFRSFLESGGDQELVGAFLGQCAYDYFVKEKVTDELVFREISDSYRRGEPVQRVSKLAFLKYYSEHTDEIRGEDTETLGIFLQELLEERIHLKLFRKFNGTGIPNAPALREMMDKTLVEYRAKPGAHVRIHYCLSQADAGEAEYLTEPMQEVYGGVFFKEFVLFFGESLQYYISEELDGQEQLTESGTLQKNDIRGGEDNWRYERINELVISRTLGDDDRMDDLLEEYYHREYLNGELFALC